MKALFTCLATVLTASSVYAGNQPESEPSVPKIRDLQVSVQARKALAEELSSILAARRRHYQRGVRISEISALSAFVREHPTTREALRAKFLIGNAYLSEGRPSEVAQGKPYFEAIVTNHPETVEGSLAKVQLRLLTLRNQADAPSRQQHIAAVREAVNAALPYTRQLDQDASDLSSLFKQRALGSDTDKFTPRLYLDLSALFHMEGRTNEAKKALQRVIEEYPSSPWSEKASRRLKSIQREEQESAARTEGP